MELIPVGTGAVIGGAYRALGNDTTSTLGKHKQALFLGGGLAASLYAQSKHLGPRNVPQAAVTTLSMFTAGRMTALMLTKRNPITNFGFATRQPVSSQAEPYGVGGTGAENDDYAVSTRHGGHPVDRPYTPGSTTPSSGPITSAEILGQGGGGGEGPFGSGPAWETAFGGAGAVKTPKYGIARSPVLGDYPGGHAVSSLGDIVSQSGVGVQPRIVNPPRLLQQPTALGFVSQAGINPQLGPRYPGVVFPDNMPVGGAQGFDVDIDNQQSSYPAVPEVIVPDNMRGGPVANRFPLAGSQGMSAHSRRRSDGERRGRGGGCAGCAAAAGGM